MPLHQVMMERHILDLAHMRKNILKIQKICDCEHEQEDHDEKDYSCLYEDCKCTKFQSFQVRLHKRKKTVTDIKFLQEDKVKDDPLAWNCLNSKKYSADKSI